VYLKAYLERKQSNDKIVNMIIGGMTWKHYVRPLINQEFLSSYNCTRVFWQKAIPFYKQKSTWNNIWTDFLRMIIAYIIIVPHIVWLYYFEWTIIATLFVFVKFLAYYNAILESLMTSMHIVILMFAFFQCFFRFTWISFSIQCLLRLNSSSVLL
jgi:hypothetical protein